jgi:hypothetical protein
MNADTTTVTGRPHRHALVWRDGRRRRRRCCNEVHTLTFLPAWAAGAPTPLLWSFRGMEKSKARRTRVMVTLVFSIFPGACAPASAESN